MPNLLRSLRGRKEARQSARPVASRLDTLNGVRPSQPPLAQGAVAADTLIEVLPYPAALWSVDRRSCVFNDALRRLLGFEEHELQDNMSLWTDQINPQDRAKFAGAWEKLENGENKVSLSYRFLPNRRSQEIRLKEIAFSYAIRDGYSRGVCSLYTVESGKDKSAGLAPTPELVRGLTHEIGNNLQTISGELDLLRISGVLSAGTSNSIKRGIEQIRRLAHEIDEYLFPPALHLKSEDPAAVLKEVVQSIEKELALHGIRVTLLAKDSLPRMLLDGQFRRALRGVIDFSRALLPQGGELKIEAGARGIGDDSYIEVRVVSCSPTPLGLDEGDVFRPFVKVNDYRVGLSMAVARQILRRHFGKIAFHKERNRGIFSILLRVSPEA